MNIILSLLILSFTACNISFAQTTGTPAKPTPQKGIKEQAKTQEAKTQIPKQAQTKTPEATPKQEIKLQEVTTKESPACNCEKLVLDAINKAYVAIEEDEWAAAIKVCTDALNTVKNLSNTCKCLDTATFKNIAQAFLDYAKGGDILDGEKEPDCEAANKLYTETIKLLGEALPKIKDAKLKENAGNITDYSKEELEFVKDECSG